MTEDLLVVVGVLVVSAVCAWYVVQSITGIALLAPADQICATATQCATALGY